MTFGSETASEQLMLLYEKVELTMEVLVQVEVLGREVVQVVAFLVNLLALRRVLIQVV